MRKLELQVRISGVDFERYRGVYFSEEFNQIAKKAAGLQERVLEHEEILSDGRELRRVKMVPEVALPGPVMKMVGDQTIAYHEVSLFDPNKRVAQLNIESPAGELIEVGGHAHFIEENNVVTMKFAGDVRVKILGLGGMIEKIIVNQVQNRYSAIEQVMQRYVDSGGQFA